MALEVLPYYATTIATVAQSTAAWTLLNPQDLIQAADLGGENLTIPGFDGELGRAHFAVGQSVDLLYVFDGNAEPDGSPHVDAIAGLALNKREFRSTVYKATRDAYGCVACTVEDGDGSLIAGNIQPVKLRFSEGLFECTAVMAVKIPVELAESGS